VNTIVAALVIVAYPPYLAGNGDSHAARPCRRRNAAARSRPHCRQRHRCSLRSIRRLSAGSGCPRPQWLGISSRRILRRSILGKWTTAVLLVQSTPPLPANSACASAETNAGASANSSAVRSRGEVVRRIPVLPSRSKKGPTATSCSGGAESRRKCTFGKQARRGAQISVILNQRSGSRPRAGHTARSRSP
jgi:hypothetical protein